MDYFTHYLEEELPLNDANEFTKEGEDAFLQFSPNKKYLILLSSKLPVMKHSFGRNSNGGTKPLTSSGAPDDYSFTIDGIRFTIPKDHYHSAVKFGIKVNKGSTYSKASFEKEFVHPFITDCQNQQIDIEAVLEQYNYHFNVSSGCQVQPEKAQSERYIEDGFIQSLRNPLNFIICHNLKMNSQNIMKQTTEYLKDKGAPVTGNDNPNPEIEPIFRHQQTFKFLGVDAVPNFTSGFQTWIECSSDLVLGIIGAIACGEIKRPSAGISSAYKSLVSGQTRWDNTCPTPPEKRLANFNDALIKSCTVAVNSGSDRFFISDYDHIIFFKIEHPFTVTSTGNYRNDTQHIVKLKHFCVNTAEEKFSRLMLLAFLWLKPGENEKLVDYKKAILLFLKENRDRHVPSFESSDANSRNKRSKQPSAGSSCEKSKLSSAGSEAGRSSRQLDLDAECIRYPDASSVLNTSSTSLTSVNIHFLKHDFLYDIGLFQHWYFISLKDLEHKIMRCGQNYNSQVFSFPRAEEFFLQLNFLNKFDSGYTGGKLVLKIYDCTWFHRIPELSFLAASNEVKAYFALKDSGITPNVLAYGQMIDNSITVGDIHPRSSGPFLFLEHVEKLPIEKHQVTKETLEEQVIPVLKKMHDHGVIHKDVKFENIIFGVHGVKVIDFGSSQISDDEKLRDDDIRDLYTDFGFQY